MSQSHQILAQLKVTDLPRCIHEDTRDALLRLAQERGDVNWEWIFSKGERAVLRHRAPVAVSKWSERHRIIHNSSRPGRWNNMVTPYAAGIMDAAFFPSVQTEVIMKCPQSAGTESVHNCIAYSLDRAPGPVLYVYPDETTARENAQDRIIPMLNASPRLRDYMTGTSDDLASLRIKLAHTTIYMAWSGSAARLGNKPIRYVVMDELDKYQSSSKEASAEALAEKRVITWGRRSIIWKLSTPTVVDGPIDLAFKTAERRYRYYAVCPQCQKEILPDFEQVGWDRDCQDPAVIRSHDLGFYTCQECGCRWNDGERDLAVRAGKWRDEATGESLEDSLTAHAPISIAFHIPALISPFVSLSEIASKLLEYEISPSVDLMKDLQNNYKGEPWQAAFEVRDEEAILSLCDDRPRGAVPGYVDGRPRVAALLAGVDTQGTNEHTGYFRYVIRAFGYGENEESWLVQTGTAPSFTALDDILWHSVYHDADGREYRVRACMIDAMGARTKEVYTWAIQHRGRVFPWQGKRAMSQPFSTTALEYFPGTKSQKVVIPGGLSLMVCDTTFFKSDLSHKLSIAPQDPGAFHLHENAGGMLLQYAREMCAEVWDDKKQGWENPKGKPNHSWDCEVMALAMAHILNINKLEQEEKTEEASHAAEVRMSRRPVPRTRSVAERLLYSRR